MGSQRVRHNLATEQQQQILRVWWYKLTLEQICSWNSSCIWRAGETDRAVTVNTRKVHSEQMSCVPYWFLSSLAILPYMHFDSSWLNFHSDLEYLLLFSPSVVPHSAIAWTAARQASLSFTLYLSLLKLVSMVLVVPSNRLVFSHTLLLLPSIFSSIRVFFFFFQCVGSSHQVTKVLELQLQHQSFQWIFSRLPLGLTGLISLQSKGLLRVFSSTTVQKHQLFSTQPSFWSTCYIHT